MAACRPPGQASRAAALQVATLRQARSAPGREEWLVRAPARSPASSSRRPITARRHSAGRVISSAVRPANRRGAASDNQLTLSLSESAQIGECPADDIDVEGLDRLNQPVGVAFSAGLPCRAAAGKVIRLVARWRRGLGVATSRRSPCETTVPEAAARA